jgi:hypothetical protein
MNEMDPFQGIDFLYSHPRVARSSQPWAERFNPVGIAEANEGKPQIAWYSTENSEEPFFNFRICVPNYMWYRKVCEALTRLFFDILRTSSAGRRDLELLDSR